MVAGIVDQRICWGSIIVGFAMGCCCVDCSTHGRGITVGLAGGQRSWTVENRLGISAPCGLMYLLEVRTQSGAIGLFVNLHCDVVRNVIVIIVWGIVLQNGKWGVDSCISLMDRLQETNV